MSNTFEDVSIPPMSKSIIDMDDSDIILLDWLDGKKLKLNTCGTFGYWLSVDLHDSISEASNEHISSRAQFISMKDIILNTNQVFMFTDHHYKYRLIPKDESYWILEGIYVYN